MPEKSGAGSGPREEPKNPVSGLPCEGQEPYTQTTAAASHAVQQQKAGARIYIQESRNQTQTFSAGHRYLNH